MAELFKKIYIDVPRAAKPVRPPKSAVKRMLIPRSHREAQGTNGHWSFPEAIDPSIYCGFVYMIRDLIMRRSYIGKKSLVGSANPSLESNWKIYFSSCEALRNAILSRPRSEFEFIILEQYKTKATVAYAETWSLCRAEVPTSDRWYNTSIEKVSWHCVEAISVRHRTRLDSLLSNKPVEPGIL